MPRYNITIEVKGDFFWTGEAKDGQDAMRTARHACFDKVTKEIWEQLGLENIDTDIVDIEEI